MRTRKISTILPLLSLLFVLCAPLLSHAASARIMAADIARMASVIRFVRGRIPGELSGEKAFTELVVSLRDVGLHVPEPAACDIDITDAALALRIITNAQRVESIQAPAVASVVHKGGAPCNTKPSPPSQDRQSPESRPSQSSPEGRSSCFFWSNMRRLRSLVKRRSTIPTAGYLDVPGARETD